MPKLGEEAADCEDALCLGSGRADGTLRAAVADGATSGAFSGVWARLVAEAFVAEPFFEVEACAARLAALVPRWSARVYSRNLPWHAIERAKRGAFTTLAGVEFSADLRRWRGVAVGDSVVAVLRDEALHASLPFASGRDFPQHPVLLSSLGGDASWNESLRAGGGELASGDIVLLATDALARTLFHALEDGTPRPRELMAELSSADASGAVARYRNDGLLQNDDVATIAIRIP